MQADGQPLLYIPPLRLAAAARQGYWGNPPGTDQYCEGRSCQVLYPAAGPPAGDRTR